MSPSHIDGSDDEKINDFESDETESAIIKRTSLATSVSKKQKKDAQSSASALVSLSNTPGKSLQPDTPSCDGRLLEISNSKSVIDDKELEKDNVGKSDSKQTDTPIGNASAVIASSVSKESLSVVSSDISKSSPSPEEEIKESSMPQRFSSIADEKRKQRWAELLWERPSTGDNNAMSAWLLEVLSVSDLEKSSKEDVSSTAANPKSNKNKQLKGRVVAPDNKLNQQECSNSLLRSKPVKKRNQSCIQSIESPTDTKAHARPKNESSDRKKSKFIKSDIR